MNEITLDMIECQACIEGRGSSPDFYHLHDHLRDVHDIDEQTYLRRYGGDADIASQEVWERFREQSGEPERTGTDRFKDKINVGGDITIESNPNGTLGPERPDGYQYPRQGAASNAIARLARAMKYRRDVYVYGHNGTGKSAGVRALCADMNRPFAKYPMRESLPPKLYFGQMEVNVDEETGQNKTEYQEGKLLRDLKGYEDEDGNRHGVCILVDDWDRAPAEYHEIFRHVLERNSQSVFIPELAKTVDIHPDTQIVATANSAGLGDQTGHYASVKRMDESMRDRFERAIKFHFLEVEEEREILGNKYPRLESNHPEVLDDIMSITKDIRRAIEQEKMYITFSHRRLEQWCTSVLELIEEKGFYQGIVHDASKAWLQWLDESHRSTVIDRFVDLHTASSNDPYDHFEDM